LAFDVFGTVVDWHGSIIRELQAFGQINEFDQDCAAFADSWRTGYAPAMDRVRRGELPWTKIDALRRMLLDDLLEQAGLARYPKPTSNISTAPGTARPVARLRGRDPHIRVQS
jgi:2-haloacid dehalogenase